MTVSGPQSEQGDVRRAALIGDGGHDDTPYLLLSIHFNSIHFNSFHINLSIISYPILSILFYSIYLAGYIGSNGTARNQCGTEMGSTIDTSMYLSCPQSGPRAYRDAV